MKAIISLAMLLVGMMGTAQTMDKPILVKNLNGIQSNVWYRNEERPNVIFCCMTDVPATKEYVEQLVIQFRGSFVDPIFYDGSDKSIRIQWELTDTKVLKLSLNDVASLIMIEEFSNEQ
jgi:hypothetical protein